MQSFFGKISSNVIVMILEIGGKKSHKLSGSLIGFQLYRNSDSSV